MSIDNAQCHGAPGDLPPYSVKVFPLSVRRSATEKSISMEYIDNMTSRYLSAQEAF